MLLVDDDCDAMRCPKSTSPTTLLEELLLELLNHGLHLRDVGCVKALRFRQFHASVWRIRLAPRGRTFTSFLTFFKSRPIRSLYVRSADLAPCRSAKRCFL